MRLLKNAKPHLNHQQHVYLGFMYGNTNYRGKWVNNKIIDALAQRALSKNITELRLDVYQNNTAAIKAYEKAGFTKYMVEMRVQLNP